MSGGPYASKKAYDLLVQCEAGLLSVTGSAESPAKRASPRRTRRRHVRLLVDPGRAGAPRPQREGATIDRHYAQALGEWMGFPALSTRVRRQRPRGSRAHTPRSCPMARSGW